MEEIQEEAPVEQVESEVEAPVERPRDEQGRFAPGEDNVLEKRLKDKDEYIGRITNELGELRKLVEQVAQPVDKQDFSRIDEDIVENLELAPQIAARAFQQGDSIAYEKAIRAWGEVDPFGALRFEQQLAAHNMQQQLLAQTAPASEQLAAYNQQRQIEQVTLQVSARIPDFQEVMSTVDPERDPVPVGLLDGLQNPATAEGSLEAFYYWAKGRMTTNSSKASERVIAERAEEQHQQKTAAAVASVSAAPVTVGTDDELEALYNAFRAPSPTSIPYR